MALYDVGRHDDALKSFDRALSLRPSYPDALNNRAGMLYAMGRVGEAAETYRRLFALSPDPQTLGALNRARMSACDWTDSDATCAQIVAQVERDVPQGDTMSLTWFSVSAALQRRAAEVYARRYAQRPLPPVARRPAERIRIGYFSLHFHEHPMAYMHVNLFERLDRSRFEVIALSYGQDDKSAMRARLAKAFALPAPHRAGLPADDRAPAQRPAAGKLRRRAGLGAGNARGRGHRYSHPRSLVSSETNLPVCGLTRCQPPQALQ